MSDGAEQSGAGAMRTGEVRVPADAGAVLPDGVGDVAGDAASLGAAEWPAGEADEPQGQAQGLDQGLDRGLDQEAPPAHQADPLR